jgi:hypothetical protein
LANSTILKGWGTLSIERERKTGTKDGPPAPASVDGEVNDPNFGKVVSAAAPRVMQLAAKFHF